MGFPSFFLLKALLPLACVYSYQSLRSAKLGVDTSSSAGRCNRALHHAEVSGESPLKKSSKTENRMNTDGRTRKPIPTGSKDQKVPIQHLSSHKAGESHPGITTTAACHRVWPERNKTSSTIKPLGNVLSKTVTLMLCTG